jgi:hypothetical protein
MRGRVCNLLLLQTQVKATLRPTASQSVCLRVKPNLGLLTTDLFFFLFQIYGLVSVGRPLWREVGSVICQSLQTRSRGNSYIPVDVLLDVLFSVRSVPYQARVYGSVCLYIPLALLSNKQFGNDVHAVTKKERRWSYRFLRSPWSIKEISCFKLKLIYDRQSVGQFVLVSGTHLRPATNFSISLKFSLDSCGFFYFIAPFLTRGRVCNLLYNCFWALPEQSLLGRRPAELTAILYCLIWDSPSLELDLEFFLRPTVSRPVRLGIGLPFGTLGQILSCSSFFVWQLLYSCFEGAFSDEKTGL